MQTQNAFANAETPLNGPETQRKGFQTRHSPRMPRTVGKSTRATSYPERCPGAPPIVAWRRHIVPAHRPTGVAYAQYKRNEVLEAVGTVRQVAAATGVSKTTVARTRRRSAPLYTFRFIGVFVFSRFCVLRFAFVRFADFSKKRFRNSQRVFAPQ